MGTSAYMYTYLGAFDKIAEWIFSGISKALTWLFNSIFGPIFEAVLEPVAAQIINLFMVSWSSILYDVFRGLLRLIDIIQTSFMLFAGVTPVTYHDESYSLVELFFTDHAVGTAFRGIILLAVTLCFVFTVVAVLRKMADVEQEQGRSLGMILTDMMKSILGFFILPAACLAAVYLAGAVLTSAYNATTQTSSSGSSKTIATTLFEVSISGAVSDLMINDNAKYQEYQTNFVTQPSANPWEHVTADKSTEDKYCIDSYINLWDLDYVVGYFSAIFLIWNLLAVSFAFVQRIFEIIMLYLVSPFFMAVMPLDGGDKLKKWESMFTAKLAGGMGQIIMVNLYLMLVPIVMNGDINLTGGVVSSENTIYNALIKLIFLLGAAMAVKNGATLFTTMMDFQAGMAEQDTMRGNMASISSAARKVKNYGKQAIRKYGQKRAASAPQRRAKEDGYKFAKAEKNYNNRMRKVEAMEKKGLTDQAKSYKKAAESEWNRSLNRYAKKGMIERSSDAKSGYKVKSNDFQYGMDKKQHKRGILSLPYKIEHLPDKFESGITKTVSAVKFSGNWLKTKGNLIGGADDYTRNVKGIAPDYWNRGKARLSNAGGRFKNSYKRIADSNFYKDAYKKGLDQADVKFSNPAEYDPKFKLVAGPKLQENASNTAKDVPTDQKADLTKSAPAGNSPSGSSGIPPKETSGISSGTPPKETSGVSSSTQAKEITGNSASIASKESLSSSAGAAPNVSSNGSVSTPTAPASAAPAAGRKESSAPQKSVKTGSIASDQSGSNKADIPDRRTEN